MSLHPQRLVYASSLTIILNLFVCLSGNRSQKGFIFTGFDGDHPGDIIIRFGEDTFFLEPLPDNWAYRAQIYRVK